MRKRLLLLDGFSALTVLGMSSEVSMLPAKHPDCVDEVVGIPTSKPTLRDKQKFPRAPKFLKKGRRR